MVKQGNKLLAWEEKYVQRQKSIETKRKIQVTNSNKL
jgi:hypothetical protein